MNIDDKTQKSIMFDFQLFGTKRYSSSYFNSSDYKDLRNTLFDTFPNSEPDVFNRLELYTTNDVLKYGRSFILKNIGTSSIKIPFNNNEELDSKLNKFFINPTSDDYDDMVNFLNKHYKVVNVYNLPVKFDISDRNANGCAKYDWFSSDYPPEFYTNLLPIYYEIGLEGRCNKLMFDAYVHEMYHALVNTRKDSIENILDKEVLPIFAEKVSADSLNIFDIENLYRLLCTKGSILNVIHDEYINKTSYGTIIEYGYILSALLSTDLFNIYYNSSDSVKVEIMGSINDIFKSKHTLEDVLKKYYVSPYNGSKIVKEYAKKYTKCFK